MKILMQFFDKNDRLLTYRYGTNTRVLAQKLASLNWQKARIKVSYPELKEEYGEVPVNEGYYYNKKDLQRAFRAFTTEVI